MSQPSPCCGARPRSSTKRWISSKPAMIAPDAASGRPPSLRGELGEFGENASKSIQSYRPSCLKRMKAAALRPCAAPGHRSRYRWQAPRSLFKAPARAARSFASSGKSALRLAEMTAASAASAPQSSPSRIRVGFTERVDAIYQIDIEFSHVHGKAADAVDQGRIRSRLFATADCHRDLLCLLSKTRAAIACCTDRLLVVASSPGYLSVTILPRRTSVSSLGAMTSSKMPRSTDACLARRRQ